MAQPTTPPTKRRKLIYTTLLLLLIISTTLLSSKSWLSQSTTFSTTALSIRNTAVVSKNNNENNRETNTDQGIPQWALNNARPLRATANSGKEVSLFWHIPKSGGTTGMSNVVKVDFDMNHSLALLIFCDI